ncbi:MAG: hypothetical protein LBK60_10105 [Verrucomicrobiales bacterium]|nr:hypothetical protein [Verrucomicrobiales bacterium]
MKAVSKNPSFDCLKMKRELQTRIYAQVKDMNFTELRAHINRTLQGDAFWRRINLARRG